jgi:hypothetical protein
VAGDFTGNGRLDLAVGETSGVQILLGNSDGTFQPATTVAAAYGVSLVAGDFTGDGHLDLAICAGYGTNANAISVLLGNGDGTFQPQVSYSVGASPQAIVAGDFNGRVDLAVANNGSNDVTVLLGNGDGTFSAPGRSDITPTGNPIVADVNGDGTDDVLVVDGSANILYRQGIPGKPGSFEPPVTVNPAPVRGLPNPYTSRDIVWLPNTDQGPVLASVDAKDNGITFYAYRAGGFVRLNGSLTTGQVPAQIVAADLDGDGQTDLVVRNAADGSLSVYYATTWSEIGFVGPVSSLESPTFLPPVTLPVGTGVSDVQAVDATGSGKLDLVVTNKLIGQVSVLRNEGNGLFAAPVPYRAGTGLSTIDPGNTPELTSLDATTSVAGVALTPGGPAELVTINPGSNTLDVLANLGGGRFANPTTVQNNTAGVIASLPSFAGTGIVRAADFTGNGINDLAVLSGDGLRIYLGDGKGGFLPPTTYAVPPESDGLTVADVTGDGKLDLSVGDAYGDVLVLAGKGDGTFEPYHEASQSIELAVADLTGNGSKDVIYADQGLDRVVVDYGAGNSAVLANQSSGLLQPGAVQLAYLAGPSYPPDLIVANSGSNNVLIYPGLGNGQFGPAINGGHGYFVGTNPVGITVANLTGALPDLVVADKGSNQVSILLNTSQNGSISFQAGPRLNAGGVGPVSTVVGHFSGGPYPDLLVTNSGSNDVKLLPGVGQGFFNDTSPKTFTVGADPVTSIVGNFNGQPDLLTVNAGSNDLTLISGFEGTNPVTTTLPSGGVDPDAAFAFTTGSGFEDLVVGNAGDGELALFEGGSNGLSLMSTEFEPSLPSPTDLAFAALTGGQVQFYAATAGRESAELVALSLSIELSTGSQLGGAPPQNTVAQLVALNETSLPLVTTVLTLTLSVSGAEINFGLVETEATAIAAFLPGTAIAVGQSLSSSGRGGPAGNGDAESDLPEASPAGPLPAGIATWQRLILGLEEALQQFQRENPNGVSAAPARDSAASEHESSHHAPRDVSPAGDRTDAAPSADVPAQGGPASSNSGASQTPSTGERDATENPSPSAAGAEAVDAIIQSVWGHEELGKGISEHRQLSVVSCQLSVESHNRQRARSSQQRTTDYEPRTADNGLLAPSLLVAAMSMQWVQMGGWKRNVRPRRSGRMGLPLRALNRRVSSASGSGEAEIPSLAPPGRGWPKAG